MKHAHTFMESVAQDQVVDRVIQLVSTATSSVIATQSSQDVSPVKPTKRYFETLKSKVAAGVSIHRYCFDQAVVDSVDENGVVQIQVPSRRCYQRVLIVDRSQAMFKAGENFFYTEFKPLVEAFIQYLEEPNNER